MKVPSFFERPAVKRSLIAIGVLALGFAAIVVTFYRKFVPSVPEANFPEPASQYEAYVQDLTFLKGYADHEKALDDPEKRERFLTFIDRALEDLQGMTPSRFELLVARAVALADNGHSNVSPVSRTRRFNHMGVRTGPFDSGQYVIQAMNRHADLVGAEIVAIEGTPVEDVLDSLASTFGGVAHRSRFFGHLMVISPQLLHADGFSESPDEVVVTFWLPDGTLLEREMSGEMLGDDRRHPYGREVLRYRVPEKDEGEWVHLLEDREPPLVLADPEEPFLRRFLDEGGVYIRLNYNYDYGGRSLKGWLKELEGGMRERRPAFAIVDMRFNGGGTDATAPFAKKLPSLVVDDGPLYVMTSAQTFSAGIGASAQFKEYGGGRTKIVGSPVGDRMRFVANGGASWVLPNSGLSIRVWSSWEDYADGCWDWGECFWLSPHFRHPGVGDLDPDISAVMTFADYVEGRDPLLEAALADFRGKES
jgi:hypothetical protein